jgi:predicted phage terminase large subunit-like protein
MTADQNMKTRYENDHTGFRIALSVDSSTTGERGDITVIDDPHNVKQAESDAVRDGTIRWHDEAFFNRVNDPKRAGRVVMGQRVHHRDLIGHLLARGGWEELRIPEEFEPARRCKTALGWCDPRSGPGELMRPERFGPAEVAEARSTMGGLAYSAQHQQNPTPREGSAFKREWLRHYTRYGTGYCCGTNNGSPTSVITLQEMNDRFLTVDTAASVKETTKDDPDYTAVSAWALVRGRLLWLGCARKRIEVPDIPRFVGEQYTKHRARRAYVEGGGTQKGAPQLIRRHQSPAMNVVELGTSGQGDKLQRANHFLVMSEAGNVWLPSNDPEFPLDVVESELLTFTGTGRGGHDDIFDTAGMAGRVAEKQAGSTSCAVPVVIQR